MSWWRGDHFTASHVCSHLHSCPFLFWKLLSKECHTSQALLGISRVRLPGEALLTGGLVCSMPKFLKEALQTPIFTAEMHTLCSLASSCGPFTECQLASSSEFQEGSKWEMCKICLPKHGFPPLLKCMCFRQRTGILFEIQLVVLQSF